MRICSLLPSATEILFAVGVGDAVVGVTHECDFPPEARLKPVVVRSRLPHGLSAGEIDRQVREFLARGESLYAVDVDALRAIEPDLVITQDLCHVCAASPHDLAAALASLSRPPAVVSLNPHSLADVWRDILTVGEATRRAGEARRLAADCERRVAAVQAAVSGAAGLPRVVCLEWLEPPYNAGHWVPEMVVRAGGADVLGRAGEPSVRVSWDAIISAQPEVILVMPCGYGVEQVVDEFARIKLPIGWEDLSAVRQGRVFAVDASSYFSRPGPRLAAGVEVLAQVVHPQLASVAAPPGAVRVVGSQATQLKALQPEMGRPESPDMPVSPVPSPRR